MADSLKLAIVNLKKNAPAAPAAQSAAERKAATLARAILFANIALAHKNMCHVGDMVRLRLECYGVSRRTAMDYANQATSQLPTEVYETPEFKCKYIEISSINDTTCIAYKVRVFINECDYATNVSRPFDRISERLRAKANK